MRLLKRIKRLRKEDYSFFIFGLGNPGEAYKNTLHNAGFMALDLLVQREGASFSRVRGNTVCSSLDLGSGEVVFIGKPQTYMNLSGEAVRYFAKKYRFSHEKLIVIHDDLDIGPGRIKVKKGGGTGGHRGIESVNGAIGSSEYTRIKIGVGRPPRGVDPVEYLLSTPLYEIEGDFNSGVSHAADAIMMCLKEGLERAINYYNSEQPYEKE